MDHEAFAGGRNWLPVTVVALLNGIQYIRLGIEDIFFLWLHKEKISHKVSQTVEMIRDLCKILGREVATVEEARKIMGIKKPRNRKAYHQMAKAFQ